MGSLHSVTAIAGHTKGCASHIVSSSHSCIGICAAVSYTHLIEQMKELVEEEEALLACKGSLPSDEMLTAAKKDGFSDKYLSQLLAVPEDSIRNRRIELGVEEAWEGIHVSGTEDSAYYYSTYNAPDKNPIRDVYKRQGKA